MGATAGRRATAAELVVGQVLGQLALVAALPVLSRVFPPEELGGLQFAMAAAVIAAPLATLCVEYVIPLASEGEVARLRARARVATGVFAVIALVGAGGLVAASAVTGAEQLVMVALLVLAYSGTFVENAVLIRRGETRRLAVRNVLAGVFGALAQVLAAFVMQLVVVVAAGVLVGRVLAVFVTRSRKPAGPDPDAPPSWDAGVVAWAATARVASLVSMQTLTLLAAPLLGIGAAGLVGVAMRVAGAPLSLAGQGLQQVAQSLLAPVLRAGGRGAVAELRVLVGGLTLVAAIVAAPVALLGPVVAPVLLGEQWSATGDVVAVLALPFALQLLSSPLFGVLVMLGRRRLLAGLQVGRLVACVVGVLVAATSGGGLLAAATVYATVETVAGLAVVGAALVAARAHDRRADPA